MSDLLKQIPNLDKLDGLNTQFSDETLAKSYTTLAERKASSNKIVPSLEEAIRLSEQKETQLHNEPKPSPDAITFREYIGQLEARAKTDESAAERLAQINEMIQSPKALTREEKQAKKLKKS